MSALQIVRLMNREDQRIARAVGRVVPQIALAVQEIVERMRSGGRLIYMGAGTSGRIGVLDASECPPTFGVSRKRVTALIAGGRRAVVQSVEGAEDHLGDAVRDLRSIQIGEKDCVVGLAASGRTPYVLAGLRYARARGAFTVGVSANRRSPVARIAKIGISLETGPEVLTGSTRLKAGTAQKMVLNMLSTAVMVRLGHVYSNLMIDMGQTNHKLRERALWVLREASGKGVSDATRALRQSGHNLRVALVMLKRRVSSREARRILREASGNLREALGE